MATPKGMVGTVLTVALLSLACHSACGQIGTTPHSAVYIPVGILPDPGLGMNSFRMYDVACDVYLKCSVMPVGDGGMPIQEASSLLIRKYVQALQEKDCDLFIQCCFPEGFTGGNRVDDKGTQQKFFDFWASRFKADLPIVPVYGLRCGESVFYLLVQRDPASVDGMNHIEVVETQPFAEGKWRCAVGEFTAVKSVVHSSLFSCATVKPRDGLDSQRKYTELPLVHGRDGVGDVLVAFPSDETARSADSIGKMCLRANEFADFILSLAEKKGLDENDKAKLGGLCTSNSAGYVLRNAEKLASPLFSGNPGSSKSLWGTLASKYRIGHEKCITIGSDKIGILWTLGDNGKVRQVSFLKEGGKFLISGAGGEMDGLAGLLTDAKFAASVASFIKENGAVSAR